MRSPLSTWLALIAALAALTFALAGCGADEKSSDTRALVTFAKSGGVAGKLSSLVVDRGGGASLTSYPAKAKTFNIGGGKRDELGRALEGFAQLESSYELKAPVADAFHYTITFEGKTVQASDGAEMPAKLKSLIGLLDGIVNDES